MKRDKVVPIRPEPKPGEVPPGMITLTPDLAIQTARTALFHIQFQIGQEVNRLCQGNKRVNPDALVKYSEGLTNASHAHLALSALTQQVIQERAQIEAEKAEKAKQAAAQAPVTPPQVQESTPAEPPPAPGAA